MSLDKAVKHGKERRKPHTGGCPWCEGNRLHKHKRREPIPDDHIIDPEEPHLMRLFCVCYSGKNRAMFAPRRRHSSSLAGFLHFFR